MISRPVTIKTCGPSVLSMGTVGFMGVVVVFVANPAGVEAARATWESLGPYWGWKLAAAGCTLLGTMGFCKWLG